MSTYQEAAQKGDAIGVVRQAVLFASLWSLGSSWVIAIRQVAMTIIPDENDDNVVVAEILAALITTTIALAATFVVTRRCSTSSSSSLEEEGVAHNRSSSQPRRRIPARRWTTMQTSRS